MLDPLVEFQQNVYRGSVGWAGTVRAEPVPRDAGRQRLAVLEGIYQHPVDAVVVNPVLVKVNDDIHLPRAADRDRQAELSLPLAL